ncbi:hypothetical protein [Methylobacterium sp. CM6244]
MIELIDRSLSAAYRVGGLTWVLIGLFLIISGWVVQLIINRRISSNYEIKLEAFKSEQNRALEEWKSEQAKEVKALEHSFAKKMDRSQKFNQHEYSVLPEAWRKFSDAFYATMRASVGPVSTYLFNMRTESEIEAVMLDRKYSGASIQHVQNADDKEAAYMLLERLRLYNEANSLNNAYINHKQHFGIFIGDDLRKKFAEIDDLMAHAMGDMESNLHVEPREKTRDAINLFRGHGRRLMGELEGAIQRRLSDSGE